MKSVPVFSEVNSCHKYILESPTHADWLICHHPRHAGEEHVQLSLSSFLSKETGNIMRKTCSHLCAWLLELSEPVSIDFNLFLATVCGWTLLRRIILVFLEARRNMLLSRCVTFYTPRKFYLSGNVPAGKLYIYYDGRWFTVIVTSKLSLFNIHNYALLRRQAELSPMTFGSRCGWNFHLNLQSVLGIELCMYTMFCIRILYVDAVV